MSPLPMERKEEFILDNTHLLEALQTHSVGIEVDISPVDTRAEHLLAGSVHFYTTREKGEDIPRTVL